MTQKNARQDGNGQKDAARAISDALRFVFISPYLISA
jgi:hypothetical protein